MKKTLIIGYDPGTTAAIAILDTNKNILLVKSKKSFKKNEIINTITKHGKPIIIASDVSPVPKSVEKLSSSLGCRVYHPQRPLTNVEKWHLVEKYMDKFKNNHEKDALASALKTFEVFSKLFKRVDRVVSYIGLIDFYDDILELLVTKKVENITDAIDTVLLKMREKKPGKEEKPERKPKHIPPEQKIELEKKIRSLENDIAILKQYNKKLKETITRYKREMNIDKHKEMEDEYREQINRAKRTLEDKILALETMKTYRRLEIAGYVPIVQPDNLELNTLKNLNQDIDLKNRLIMVKNLNNVQNINNYEIMGVISEEIPDKNILGRVNFPIIPKKNLQIERIKGVLSVKERNLEDRIKNARKAGLVQWITKHKKRKI